MGHTIIETEELSKRYGETVAVNRLNLSIQEGEIFGLLGPNGAGKTTTILMLLGLTEPFKGKASIAGMDCTRNPIGVKSIVGYLPDNVGFYPDMTGRENLRFTGKMNGIYGDELEDRIELLLERVSMTDAADKKTRTYSKGMRQRLGIADILIKDPKVIIMDEPTLGIDPQGMQELLSLMRRLSEEDGRTLLISSHQLYQIQQICDRVGIFVSGNLVACGTIEELGKQVQKDNHYSLELSADPCDDRLLEQIRRIAGVSTVTSKDNVLSIQSGRDIRQELTAFLGQNGYTILHMHQRGGDLDEIYRLYFEKAGQNDENHSNEGKKNRDSLSRSEKKQAREKARIELRALYEKEMADNLTSKRFVIILLLIYATSFASLYGALTSILESEDSVTYMFLSLYTTSGNSIPSFMSFIALLGPFVGLTLGFDAINSERSAGTLNRLVAQPIYRDSIIIGKFLAGTTIISIMVISMGVLIGAVGVLVTGQVPQAEEVLRIAAFLIFIIVYIAFWLGLSIFFSVITRHSATSALAVIAIWIFLAIFMSLLANIIANAVYPVDTTYNAAVNTLANYTLDLNLNRISPYYLFSEAATTIMNPSVRSVNVVTVDQLDGAISGYLSFGQSLLLVWPHLVGLIALMFAAFIGSYIGFMRQEVRAS